MTARTADILAQLEATAGDGDRKLVIANGYVVSMDPRLGDLEADILIVGRNIVEVRRGLADEIDDAIVIDASGCAVMPGFVDSHIHSWESPIRGTDPAGDYIAYVGITHGGVAAHITPEDVEVGQRLTAAQALNVGVTTIIDNSHIGRTREHSDAAIRGLQESGIRAVHAAGPPVLLSFGGDQFPGDLFRLRSEYFSSTDQLLTLRMFDEAPTPETWAWARNHDFDIVMEMGTHYDNLEELFATGLSHPGHTYNHCFGLTDDMWNRIADSGAAVNVAPRSDPHFGLGAFMFPSTLEADRRNVKVGISCDNEIAYGYDMFTEMRVLMTVQRALVFGGQRAGDADMPAPYSPTDVLRAATMGGATNARLDDRIGSITPGKRADIVLLDLDLVHTRPFGAYHGTIVSWANVANVDTVLVDGQVRKWAGKLTGLDYDGLVAAAESTRERLWAALGTSTEQVRAGWSPARAFDDDFLSSHVSQATS